MCSLSLIMRRTFFCWIAFLIISGGLPGEIHAQQPSPDIKINGSDGPVTISQTETLTLSLALDNNDVSDRCDWWVAAAAPFGIFFYTPGKGWTTSPLPAYQGNLFSLPLYEFASIPPLSIPPGTYVFYFGLDASADGRVTSGSLIYDSATVNIVTGGRSVSRQIGSEGGSINLQNSHGDLITLTIPMDALEETKTITLTALDTPPENPIGINVFPGVLIQPDGLMLQEPASLDVVFANPLSMPDQSLLLYLRQSDFVVPIGRQTAGATEINGEIYHFSTYIGGQPSGMEAGAQADGISTAPNPTPSNWQSTFENVYGLLKWAELFQALGNDTAAQQYIDAAQKVLKADASGFLALPVPSDPCGSYANIMFKYAEAVMSLIGAGDLETQFQNRIMDTVNRCSFRGSLAITYFLMMCPPEYSVTVNVPFHVEIYNPPYTNIVGGSASSPVKSIMEVCDPDCPLDFSGSLAVRNLGGELMVDSQGNFALHFTYEVSNPLKIKPLCSDITSGNDDKWWESEVTIPAIDGYAYNYDAHSTFRFKLHIKAMP